MRRDVIKIRFGAKTKPLLAYFLFYSATGLAKDSGYPGGFVRDLDTGELVPVSEVDLPPRETAMIINLVLILLGVLDIMFTLPCCIICLRELCDCYNGTSGGSSLGLLASEGHAPIDDRGDWLMSWLGQPQPHPHQIYFSQSSAHMPKLTPPPAYAAAAATPSFYMLPAPQPTQESQSHHRSSHRSSHRSQRGVANNSGRRSHSHDSATYRHLQQQQQHESDHSSRARRSRSKSPRHSSSERPVSSSKQHQQQQLLVPAGHHFPPHPMELYYPYMAAPPLASYPSPGSQLIYHPGWGMYGVAPPPPPPVLPSGMPAGVSPEDYEAYLNPYMYHHPAGGDPYQYVQYGPASAASMRGGGSRPRSASRRKRPRSKSGGRSEVEAGVEANFNEMKPKNNSHGKRRGRGGPTDSDIEKTYTGLDRELAEEFIEQTMDPAVVVQQGDRTLVSGTESEAW